MTKPKTDAPAAADPTAVTGMPPATPITTVAVAVAPEHPAEGGSYVRQPDGSLSRIAFTSHAPVADGAPDSKEG